MLYFRDPRDGERIPVCLDDARLTPVFGVSYEQGENLAGLLDLVIESEDHFVAIIMQGSRRADVEEADRELAQKLKQETAPFHDGYTWHHKEDIERVGGRWKCNMYLVESGFHRRHPHRGGVYMYEYYTGRSYT